MMDPRYPLEKLIHTNRAIDNTPTESVLPNLSRLSDNVGKLEDLVGVRLSISSGYRCLELNRAVKSLDTSAHLKGNAIDCTGAGLTPLQLCARIIKRNGLVLLGIDQLIYEGTWAHVGWSNGTPRRECRTRSVVRLPNGKVKTTYPLGISYVDEGLTV